MNYLNKQTGVVAEFEGKYWGVEREGGGHGEGTSYAFGPIQKASVSNPEHCHKPTDMTYKGSFNTKQLSRATLRHVTITTIYEVEEG